MSDLRGYLDADERVGKGSPLFRGEVNRMYRVLFLTCARTRLIVFEVQLVGPLIDGQTLEVVAVVAHLAFRNVTSQNRNFMDTVKFYFMFLEFHENFTPIVTNVVSSEP